MVYYVKMLDVCVTLACVMFWYAYRERLDVGRDPMIVLYANAFVIDAYVCMIIFLYIYMYSERGPMPDMA